ncbi:MAG: phosphatase PAP2 family protein, partial [Chitinophagales bacterium]
VTLLGEWVGLVGLAIYLLIKNRRALISALLAFIPINIFLQYIKKAMDFPRPLLYFNQGEVSPIPDYIPLYKHSMPSGHTYTAFYCMTFLIFFYNLNRSWQALLFPIAILVGVSRMYLMCHFKEDVFVGSILGILAGVLSVVIYEKGLKRI